MVTTYLPYVLHFLPIVINIARVEIDLLVLCIYEPLVLDRGVIIWGEWRMTPRIVSLCIHNHVQCPLHCYIIVLYLLRRIIKHMQTEHSVGLTAWMGLTLMTVN